MVKFNSYLQFIFFISFAACTYIHKFKTEINCSHFTAHLVEIENFIWLVLLRVRQQRALGADVRETTDYDFAKNESLLSEGETEDFPLILNEISMYCIV